MPVEQFRSKLWKTIKIVRRNMLSSGSPQYLLRFDDICPTMDWGRWEAIEKVLRQLQVRPVLAVVPDNHDGTLCVDPPRPDFWERVRKWQQTGWCIGLHGYQHSYVNRIRGMIGLTAQSEFAGLSCAEQEHKLAAAVATFVRHGVKPEAWIAPSHSFDATTVQLLPKLGIKVISDGLWHWPHTDRSGITWVPQQLWSLRRKGPGVWTVCYHHNGWSPAELAQFRRDVQDFAGQLTSLEQVLQSFSGRRLRLTDRLVCAWELYINYRAKPFVARCIPSGMVSDRC